MSQRLLSLGLLPCALLVTSPAAADGPTKQECVSANESAQDLQHAGKLREARARLTVCIADSCPGPVREDCAQRLDEVDRVMPSLVFEVRDESDRDLSAVRVSMDGQLLTEKLDGTAIPVDLGEHHFVFEARGLASDARTLVVREGDRKRRERIVLVPAQVALPASPATPVVSESRAAERPASVGGTQRTIGLVLGGVGVVGLVVGSVLGLVSRSTYYGALGSQCGSAIGSSDARTCNATGVKDVDSAHGQAAGSTVGFIAGAVLLGAGATMYFTAPKAAGVSVGPAVGAGGAGLAVRGRW